MCNNLVGFIDGALSQVNTYPGHARICEVLMKSLSQTSFNFSGPSSKCTPVEVEEDALQLLLEAITAKNLVETNIIIASDVQLRNRHIEIPNGVATRTLQLLANLSRAKVVHINRRFNSIANRLATDGKCIGDVLAGWT